MSQVDTEGTIEPDPPDFAALFAVCGCDRDDCPRCASEWITPRTAARLWLAGGELSNGLFDALDLDASETFGQTEFARLPRVVERQDVVWRRRFVQAVDDLASDLAAGRYPRPRCTGEEMALHLLLEDAEQLDELEDMIALCYPSLPRYSRDYDWGLLDEILFEDHDVELLFEDALDGVEDPDNPRNRELGIGLLRPSDWFITFNNREPRESKPIATSRIRITSVIDVEVTDAEALRAAALIEVLASDFTKQGEREEAAAEVQVDTLAALSQLVAVEDFIQGIPGIATVTSETTVEFLKPNEAPS